MAQNKSWKELMERQGQAGGSSQQKANAMLELIEGRQPFAYDPNTDPAAKAVRQETARNIARTTKDTLGGYAAMTGGMPSTAAVSAAAQAGNQAAVTGADRIAELEQLARQNYMNEGNQMQAYWSMLQGQADSEYSRQMQEQQIAYQKEQNDYDRKYQLALLQAQYGDYSGLKALGVDASKMGSGGGSWGGSGGSGGNNGGGGGGNDSAGPQGIDSADQNDLKMARADGNYRSVWYELEKKYGAAALIEAGFERPAVSAGSGTANRETSRVNMIM